MPEKILFAVDVGREAGCELIKHGQQFYTRLDSTKRLLKRFVHMKHLLNKAHEFGVCLLTDTTAWHHRLSPSTDAALAAIDRIAFHDTSYAAWDAHSLINLILPELPPSDASYTLRVILIYARSQTIPDFADAAAASAFFARNERVVFDTVYLHDPASASNNVQSIFEVIGSFEAANRSRTVELSRQLSRYLLGMTELLASADQRGLNVDHRWGFGASGSL
ncbi:hypothetical protein BC831DRAFT_450203 [Entophlyctis helioformis]|nr:hypothetical protein BC831DRAFT_450203 [Entophlyctis helioformis]